jgi:hypothetical protein
MDTADEANDLAAAEADSLIAKARVASAAIGEPVNGQCHACLDDDVTVRHCGGMLRCTPCRSRWEKRR